MARFNNTAQNPVLLNTVGLWLMYFEIPTLPQLPPSATVLHALWPRLQNYAITSKDDPLYDTCTAGAAGDEVCSNIREIAKLLVAIITGGVRLDW